MAIEEKPYCVISRNIVDQRQRQWMGDINQAIEHAASYLSPNTREMLVVKIVKVVRRKSDYEVIDIYPNV